MNIPWRFFGQDFSGRQYDSEFFDKMFEKVAGSVIHTLRMWVHCDGRAIPRLGSEKVSR